MKLVAKNTNRQPVIAFLGCTVGLVLALCSPAWAVTYSTQYEMDTDPSVSAGVRDGSAGDFNGNGLMTVSPDGSGATFSSGIMEYIDNNASGNLGYYFAHSPAADTSFTVDMRVKVISGVAPGGASRSMSFSGGLNDGGNGGRNRGMRLNTGSVQFVNATGAVATGNQDLATAFVRLRITYNSATNSFSAYNLDAATTLCSPFLGGGTGADGFVSDVGGYSIGAHGGSSTTDTHYLLDYYRILLGTAIEDATTVIDQIPLPGCTELVTPTTTQTPTGYALGASNAPFASIDLGAVDVADGMTHSTCCDGGSTATTIGGRDCEQSNPPTHSYMYFAIDDARAFNGSVPGVTISVDYFDTGTQTIVLNYDGASSPYTSVALVTLTNTNTWKTASVDIFDAKFSNSENGGSDFRIAAAATFYLDTVSVTRTGGPTVDYSVANTGGSTFNWTASEVDCSGTSFNYPWLTLSATSGSLAASATAPVRASIDTTSLTAGSQTAYVKFTSDCPLPAACLTEPFTYSDGNLVGQGGWTGSGTQIGVSSNQAKIIGGGSSDTADKAVNCGVSSDGVISVKIDVKQGGNANTETNFWQFQAFDASNKSFGLWQGTQFNIAAKNPLDSNQATSHALDLTYKTIEMRIDTGCHTTAFYYDNTLVVTYPFDATAAHTVDHIELHTLGNGVTSSNDFVLLDNASVSVLSQYNLRQINLTVIGCSIIVQEPRIRFLGPCNTSSTTAELFTVKNNGSAAWTGFDAQEVFDDPWMTLSYTSGPVNRFATATVTATVDWGQVPTGTEADRYSRIRFRATCDGGSSYVADTPVDGDNTVTAATGDNFETVNLNDIVPAPVKILYNGDISPGADNAAGTGYKFALFEGIDQGAVVADGGGSGAVDGFAYRLNDSGSAKTKWQSVVNAGTAAMDIDNRIGATAMARVKVIASSGTSFQSNLTILHSTIAGSYYWGGANNVVNESNRDIPVTVAGDAEYHIIRITSKDTQAPGTGIVVKLYLDENPTPVLTITNALPSAHGTVEGIGFGAGSTAQSQDIYFDWVTGTNAGAFAPGDEVGCIGSLIPSSNCNTPKVDTDGDSDVDMDDFAAFQKCYTGQLVSPPPLSQTCDCFDNDNDNDVDVIDFNHFVDCETGATVPWVTSVNCPN